jgi:hypothetical protein
MVRQVSERETAPRLVETDALMSLCFRQKSALEELLAE